MDNDLQTWDQAVTAAGAMYDRLPPGTRAELDGLIDEIMLHKQRLVDLVTCAGSSLICRDCQGQCCLFGKYHVSTLDLLAYLRTGTEPLVPVFGSGPACPYGDIAGCRLPAAYRPVTCVIFNCEPVEELLSPAERQALQEEERKLRDAVVRAASLCRVRLDRPLLLSHS